MVGKSDFNENPQSDLDLDLGFVNVCFARESGMQLLLKVISNIIGLILCHSYVELRLS